MTSLNMLFLCLGDCLLITPTLQHLGMPNTSMFPPLCPVHKTGIAPLPILVILGVARNPKHVCLLCESHTFLLKWLLHQLSDPLKLKQESVGTSVGEQTLCPLLFFFILLKLPHTSSSCKHRSGRSQASLFIRHPYTFLTTAGKHPSPRLVSIIQLPHM